jgi:hypothetical protein
VAVIGVALLVYGATGLLFGGSGFSGAFPDGTVAGQAWLGITGNGWTNLLFLGAGVLLIAAAPGHRSAKGTAMLVALCLSAAAVIALVATDSAILANVFTPPPTRRRLPAGAGLRARMYAG